MRKCLTVCLSVAALSPMSLARCQRVERPPQIRYWEADSIVLDRLRGGWDRKTYRIVITKVGSVLVSPDSVARWLFPVTHVRPEQFHDIMGLLLVGQFARLPDSIAADAVFGQTCGSDSPTMIITVYHPQLTKRVVDDQGCLYAPAFLRDIERLMLETAGLRKPNEA